MISKLTNLITAAAAFLMVIAVFAVDRGMAQDPTVVDSKHYKVEFENDRVRVLRVSYGAKERSVMHVHPEGVVIALSDTQTRFTFADGKKEKRGYKAGDTFWTPAGAHLPENMSGKAFQVILVELKDGSGGYAMPAAEDDSVKADPKHHKVEFENERVRVLRSIIAPHAKTRMHAHPDNVVVFLTETSARSTMGDGKAEHVQGKAGQVGWRGSLKHDAENLSDMPLEVITVELKSK